MMIKLLAVLLVSAVLVQGNGEPVEEQDNEMEYDDESDVDQSVAGSFWWKPPNPCKGKWVEFKGKYYLFCTSRRTNTQASSECRKRKAYLVAIESQEELKFVLKRYDPTNNPTGELWTSGLRRGSQYFWNQPKGGIIARNNLMWCHGEPNNAGNVEDRVELVKTYGHWCLNDNKYDAKHHFVCEYYGS